MASASRSLLDLYFFFMCMQDGVYAYLIIMHALPSSDCHKLHSAWSYRVTSRSFLSDKDFQTRQAEIPLEGTQIYRKHKIETGSEIDVKDTQWDVNRQEL